MQLFKKIFSVFSLILLISACQPNILDQKSKYFRELIEKSSPNPYAGKVFELNIKENKDEIFPEKNLQEDGFILEPPFEIVKIPDIQCGLYKYQLSQEYSRANLYSLFMDRRGIIYYKIVIYRNEKCEIKSIIGLTYRVVI